MDKFYTNDAVILEKQLELDYSPIKTDLDILNDKYEVSQCVEWIQQNGYKKVCLQFPDYLLPDSVSLSLKFREVLGENVYILADTSYESCCVDYVAADHIQSDAIIHFGPTCYSKQSNRLPTLFIYEKLPISLNKLKEAVENLTNQIQEEIFVILDTAYSYKLGEIREMLQLKVQLTNSPLNNQEACYLYIGENNRKLMLLHLSYRHYLLYNYDPKAGRLSKYTMNEAILKRRNFLTEKIKDAQSVAIVVGTLAINNYLATIERVKTLCKLHGKKYYIISVGKVNVAKLANFPEMDVYVLISCAMNAIYDSRDFYKPIVTVFDVEQALNVTSVTVTAQFNYDCDITALAALDEKEIQLASENSGGDVSLLTGDVRTVSGGVAAGGGAGDGDSDSIATRGQQSLTVTGGGRQFERTWRGLEQQQQVGEGDVVVLAVEGRAGIPQSYDK